MRGRHYVRWRAAQARAREVRRLRLPLLANAGKWSGRTWKRALSLGTRQGNLGNAHRGFTEVRPLLSRQLRQEVREVLDGDVDA